MLGHERNDFIPLFASVYVNHWVSQESHDGL